LEFKNFNPYCKSIIGGSCGKWEDLRFRRLYWFRNGKLHDCNRHDLSSDECDGKNNPALDEWTVKSPIIYFKNHKNKNKTIIILASNKGRRLSQEQLVLDL
jgi:hypothetical protein